MRHNVRRFQRLTGGTDPILLLSCLALVGIGVLMVYSASIASSLQTYGTALYVFQRQVVWAGLGCIALGVGTRVPYPFWRRVALPFAAISVLMLLLVLVPQVGHMANGARRWFQLTSSVDVQPSELAKLTLIMYLSAWLARKGELVTDLVHTFVPFTWVLAFVAALVIKEPDLGTALVLVIIMVTIYFVAGADMLPLGALGLVVAGLAWLVIQRSKYRLDRLTAFQNPWKDATGVGYHTVQVLLALGTGGIFGRGLGNSIEKDVLPAPHTDSILAVIGEEWGLVGTTLVLLLFLVLAYRGVRVAMAAPDAFGRLLATGITAWVTFQALLNFGVITSSVPFTGVPLPFISYGGTSLVITMAGMGILLNISRYASGAIRAQDSPRDGGRNGGTRVPRVIDHPVAGPVRRGAAGAIAHRRISAAPGHAEPIGSGATVRSGH